MYDGEKIIAGIFLFLCFATFPFYSNIGKMYKSPVIKIPLTGKCVESKEYMKAKHMKLLIKWRDAALREGKRIYVNSEGKKYDVSLQNTCLKCHERRRFCDKCHTHVGVDPYCWDCHLESNRIKREVTHHFNGK